MEDAEFALRLEPNNQEIKKQYAEAKSLYDKELLKKASGALRSLVSVEKVGKSKVVVNGDVGGVQSVSSSSQKMGATAIQEDLNKDSNGKVPSNTYMSVLEIESKTTRSKGQEADTSCEDGGDGVQSSGLESSKVTSPVALPQIFKNALSAPILIDIIRCIATFFTEEMDLAVKYVENLAKVSRFDMIIMCLSSTERTGIWDEQPTVRTAPKLVIDFGRLAQENECYWPGQGYFKPFRYGDQTKARKLNKK